MNRAELEAGLAALLREHEGRKDNLRCVMCTACERCSDSTFCKSSKALARCHYCVGCEHCQGCTHCRDSKNLLSCNHCVASENCSRSSYVIKSVDCHGCTYCFGCVGLSDKDFHILNKPYDRSTYFALTAKLMKEMRLG